jgi:hypothetical protein
MELPSNNREIAKDIAAMANDGGVLVYGIAEDADGRPSVLNPIPLANRPERITSITQTSIAEPPEIMISSVPTVADPSKGYLVVVVPPSIRAPHMVVVKRDNRYYGRTATGNTPLSEGEVARLYQRRQQWEVDRDVLLTEGIRRAPFPPRAGFAYLHIIAQPVLRSEGILDRAVQPGETIQKMLHDLVAMVAESAVFPRLYGPDFSPPGRWTHRTEGFLGELDYPGRDGDPGAPARTLNLLVDFDGGGHLFCGRAAEQVEEMLMFFPSLVAGNTTRFVALLGEIYARAKNIGMVDIGIAVTGIKGSVPHSKGFVVRSSLTPYDRDEYRRTNRVSALMFKSDPREMARKLLMLLFNAVSQGRIDPFKRAQA